MSPYLMLSKYLIADDYTKHKEKAVNKTSAVAHTANIVDVPRKTNYTIAQCDITILCGVKDVDERFLIITKPGKAKSKCEKIRYRGTLLKSEYSFKIDCIDPNHIYYDATKRPLVTIW
uniref:Uncharacterized protein n=1 Tax=Glossina austeni TaxID=7395 RepID=A0A1A9VPM8_GLOAU